MIMDQDVSVQTRSLGMLTSAQHDLSDLYFFSSDSIHKRIKAALFKQDFLCRDASTAHSRQAEQGETPHSDSQAAIISFNVPSQGWVSDPWFN